MKKLAVAAAVLGVSAMLISQAPARGGGFTFAPAMHGMHAMPHNMRARPPLYTGVAPNFRPRGGAFAAHRFAHGRFLAQRFHHRGRGFAFGFGAVAIAEPVIYEVPIYEEPAPGAVAVWRGNGAGACTAETLPVHTSHGMDEVTITRC